MQRLQVAYADSPATFDNDGADVIEGLGTSPKFIPSRYSYDEIGSKLFDAITREPSYYLYRCELEVLETYAAQIVSICRAGELVELGSGAATKTRAILHAMSDPDRTVRYVPVDISEEILLSSSRELLASFPHLQIAGLATRYGEALQWLRQSEGASRLFLYLGSTLGNMEADRRQSLLGEIREAMQDGDHLLVGADLAKDKEIIETAYNSQANAAFILNKLAHLNYRFGGNFDIGQFGHRASYDPVTCQTEARLYALTKQDVALGALGLNIAIAEGEYLVAERMFKFTPEGLAGELQQAGLKPVAFWADRANWYGMALCRPA